MGRGADEDDEAGVEEGAVRGTILTVLVKIRERRRREGAPRQEARPPDAKRLGGRAQGSGCGVEGVGFRVWGSGFGVQGLGVTTATVICIPSSPSNPPADLEPFFADLPLEPFDFRGGLCAWPAVEALGSGRAPHSKLRANPEPEHLSRLTVAVSYILETAVFGMIRNGRFFNVKKRSFLKYQETAVS